MDYTSLPTPEILARTIDALKRNNFIPQVVQTGAEALEKIKELVPAGASVMNGTSTTLEEIGYIDLLKSGNHNWINPKEAILAEKDPEKQSLLRKQFVLSDYYLGSAHAVTEDGKLVFASNSGSQLPHLVYTSPNLILIVSSNKIVPNIDGAFKRIEEYVYPLEDQRMKNTGASGSFISKQLILNREPEYANRKFHVIFVNEKLGF